MVRHWFRRPARRTAATGSRPAPTPLRLAADRPASDAEPVSGHGDDRARFRCGTEREPAARLRFERAHRRRGRLAGSRSRPTDPGSSPSAGRDRSRRPARHRDGSAASGEAGDEVVSTPSATQCAAVRIRSPSFESRRPRCRCAGLPPEEQRADPGVRWHGGGGHLRRRRCVARYVGFRQGRLAATGSDREQPDHRHSRHPHGT